MSVSSRCWLLCVLLLTTCNCSFWGLPQARELLCVTKSQKRLFPSPLPRHHHCCRSGKAQLPRPSPPQITLRSSLCVRLGRALLPKHRPAPPLPFPWSSSLPDSFLREALPQPIIWALHLLSKHLNYTLWEGLHSMFKYNSCSFGSLSMVIITVSDCFHWFSD